MKPLRTADGAVATHRFTWVVRLRTDISEPVQHVQCRIPVAVSTSAGAAQDRTRTGVCQSPPSGDEL